MIDGDVRGAVVEVVGQQAGRERQERDEQQQEQVEAHHRRSAALTKRLRLLCAIHTPPMNAKLMK